MVPNSPLLFIMLYPSPLQPSHITSPHVTIRLSLDHHRCRLYCLVRLVIPSDASPSFKNRLTLLFIYLSYSSHLWPM